MILRIEASRDSDMVEIVSEDGKTLWAIVHNDLFWDWVLRQRAANPQNDFRNLSDFLPLTVNLEVLAYNASEDE